MISLSRFTGFFFTKPAVRPALVTDALAVSRALVDTRRTSNKTHLPESYLAILNPEKFEIEYRNAAASPSAREILLVAARGNSILGFIHGKPTVDAPGENSIELKEIYIYPEAQRRGLGTELLEKFMNDARKMGVKEVFVWVLETNTGAREFYERLGAEYSRSATRLIGGVECSLVVYVWSENKMRNL